MHWILGLMVLFAAVIFLAALIVVGDRIGEARFAANEPERIPHDSLQLIALRDDRIRDNIARVVAELRIHGSERSVKAMLKRYPKHLWPEEFLTESEITARLQTRKEEAGWPSPGGPGVIELDPVIRKKD